MPDHGYFETYSYKVNVGLLIKQFEAKGCTYWKAVKCAHRKARRIRSKGRKRGMDIE